MKFLKYLLVSFLILGNTVVSQTVNANENDSISSTIVGPVRKNLEKNSREVILGSNELLEKTSDEEIKKSLYETTVDSLMGYNSGYVDSSSDMDDTQPSTELTNDSQQEEQSESSQSSSQQNPNSGTLTEQVSPQPTNTEDSQPIAENETNSVTDAVVSNNKAITPIKTIDWEGIYDSKKDRLILQRFRGQTYKTDMVVPRTLKIAIVGTTQRDVYTEIEKLDKNFLGTVAGRLTSFSIPGLVSVNNGDLSNLFANEKNLKSVDLSGVESAKISNMDGMFAGCDNLEQVNLKFYGNGILNASMTNLFKTDSKRPLLVISDDPSLQSYNYAADNRYPLGPKFEVNGGSFESGSSETTKYYFDKCVVSPTSDKLKLTTFKNFKNNLKPTKNGSVFIEWELTSGNEPTTDDSLKSSITYTAKWGIAELSEWKYSDKNSYILLEKYLGSSKELVVPNEVNGKPTRLEQLNTSSIPHLRTTLSSLTIKPTADGKRVKLEAQPSNSLSGVFQYAKSIKKVDLSGLDIGNVYSMSTMFSDCENLESVDLSINTSNVTRMSFLFSSCSNLTNVNLGEDFNTSKVEYANNMFSGCSSLESLDLGDKFDTSKMKSGTEFFYNCSSLVDLDLGDKFNTSSMTSMKKMFANCDKLVYLDLSNFNTSNVPEEQMADMFITSDYNYAELLIKTNDEKLLNRNYEFEDFRFPPGPQFIGKGGYFDSGYADIYYFEQCAIRSDSPKFQIETFNNFKNTVRPTRDGYTFVGWNFDGTEPTTNEELLISDAFYFAQWDIPSNIPSQDDNETTKPYSSYGIAYIPTQLTFAPTKLQDEGVQIIPFEKLDSFHIGVRDYRNTPSSWQLSGQLQWDGKVLTGAEIVVDNPTGTIKKNINNGENEFDPDLDFIDCPSTEAVGQSNVVITSNSSAVIMSGKKVPHTATYDYNLGDIYLRIPEAKKVEATSYSGKVIWNLSNTL